MRYLTLLVTLPVTVAVVVFAVNNRGDVVLDPWPFDAAVTLPVFVVALVPFVIGFIAGGVAQWAGGLGRKHAVRRKRTRSEDDQGAAGTQTSGRALTVGGDGAGTGG